jgi:hypothetical protein
LAPAGKIKMHPRTSLEGNDGLQHERVGGDCSNSPLAPAWKAITASNIRQCLN